MKNVRAIVAAAAVLAAAGICVGRKEAKRV